MLEPNSQPPPRTSSAIYSGADLIITLVEEELKNHDAAQAEKIKTIQSQFLRYREFAAVSHAKADLRIRELEAELEQNRSDISIVHKELEMAEAEARKAKDQLGLLRASLEGIGITFSDDLVLRFDEERSQQLLDELVSINKTRNVDSSGVDVRIKKFQHQSLDVYDNFYQGQFVRDNLTHNTNPTITRRSMPVDPHPADVEATRLCEP